MSPTRTRLLGLPLSAALALSTLGLAAPVVAADSPQAAVEDFFAAVTDRDSARIGELVCAEERDAAMAQFDIESQMGLDGAGDLADKIIFEVRDLSVDVTSNDGQTATGQVTANVSISTPEDAMEAIVRALMAADVGPDDPPLSDDDLAFMMSFMSSALNSSQPFDQEVTFVVEDGEWLVCGGLVDAPQEPDDGFEPTVSSEGLCGLASPEEMTAMGALAYDSSNGIESFCSYSNSDYDDYHSIGLTLELDQRLETYAELFGADTQVEVAGRPAYATGPDGYGTQLLMQVGSDLLTVTVTLPDPPPDDVDWLTEATLAAELFLPRLDAYRLELAGPTPEPTPLPTPEISLCNSLSLADLNALSGLAFDDATGDSRYCSFSSLDPQVGFNTVILSLDQFDLDSMREYLPEGEDVEVAGRSAYQAEGQLWVDLADRGETLTVMALLVSASGESTEVADMARQIAERVIDSLPPASNE